MIRRYSLAAVAWLYLASQLFAATVRWTGAAQDVRQVSTITVAGTWATGDTATLTINNKSVTVTAGSSTSTSNIADIIARAVDAANDTEDALGNETRNFGGEEIPEFAEIDASSSGAVLTLTSEVPGVPFTMTRSEVTAGDGTLGAVTAVTAATGKNWLSNAANYSGGSVPVDNDTLVIDTGDADILYALDHFRTGNIDLIVVITNDYTGQIGNPAENPLGYVEYRTPRYFQYRGGSKKLTLDTGVQGNTECGKIYLDFQDQASVDIELLASRSANLANPSVFLSGADATTALATATIKAGNVAIEPTDTAAAAAKKWFCSATFIGIPGNAEASPIVTIGSDARLISGGADVLTVYSGTVYCKAEASDGVTNRTDFTIRGGKMVHSGIGSTGTIPAVVVGVGGSFVLDGTGDAGGFVIGDQNINVYGGTLDVSRAVAINQVADVNVYSGSVVNYPNYNGLNAIGLVGCTLADVRLVLPTNRLVDISAAP